MEKTIKYNSINRLKENQRMFNFFAMIFTIASGIFTWLAGVLKDVLMIEAGILVFTTSLTVLGVNLILDLTVKSDTNSWIFASYRRTQVQADRKCEHRPSMFSGKSGSLLSKFFKKSWAHFAIIFPSFLVFYVVMVVGLVGYEKVDPLGISLVNFASDISWFLWFPILWVLTWVANGRVWCQTCPFSGQAEWLHRRHPWKKVKNKIGLNLRWPMKYSTILYSAVGFSVLTWVEEFYNIGGPGIPALTSMVLIYIAVLELFVTLIFQDRTFCRTLCPLSVPLAITTMISPLGTFRAKDPEKCKKCTTKDCMKGNKEYYGCPWFASPGSKENSPMCGLASDCYKACPHDNIDWNVKRFPWLSDLTTGRKRFDVGLSVLILLGTVLFQFMNALPFYTMVDEWLCNVTGWSKLSQGLTIGLSRFGYSNYGYPDPIDYAFINAIPVIAVYLLARSVAKIGIPFKWSFTSLSYSLIPIFASAILARNLPKLLGGAALILNEIADPTGSYLRNSQVTSTFWGRVLHYLGSNPYQAHAEWWVLLIMEGVIIFGIYLGIRASNMLSQSDGISKKYYYSVVLGFGLAFILMTYWMSSPMSPSLSFYNPYLGNLMYNPLDATPPF